MSQSRRNVIVGFTVIGALIALGWMLLRFGSAPVKLLGHHDVLAVHFVASRADGLAEGSQVLYRGVSVGEITHISREANGRDVLIDANIDNVPPLPGNVTGVIRTLSLISGSAAITLELTGGPDAPPTGTLTDGEQLAAQYLGSDLIPPQFGTLATQLEEATRDFRTAGIIAHLDTAVQQANNTLKSLQNYVNDPAMKDDLRTAIANFRQTTDSAHRTALNVEAFSGNLQKLGDQASGTIGRASETIVQAQADLDRVSTSVDNRLVQISKLLDSVQSITNKVDAGQGTAGALVNDPKLYQSLVDSSRELNLTVTDLHRLIQQWEQEGVTLKLH